MYLFKEGTGAVENQSLVFQDYILRAISDLLQM